jgi:hypothetical protein
LVRLYVLIHAVAYAENIKLPGGPHFYTKAPQHIKEKQLGPQIPIETNEARIPAMLVPDGGAGARWSGRSSVFWAPELGVGAELGGLGAGARVGMELDGLGAEVRVERSSVIGAADAP